MSIPHLLSLSTAGGWGFWAESWLPGGMLSPVPAPLLQAWAGSYLSQCNSSRSQQAQPEFASSYKYLGEQQSPQRLEALYIVFCSRKTTCTGAGWWDLLLGTGGRRGHEMGVG